MTLMELLKKKKEPELPFRRDVAVFEARPAEGLSTAQAKERMAEPGVIVLDVRMQQEYDAGHIANAVLLPLPLIEAGDAAVAKALPDKDAEILVYCRSGRRSAIAANALINRGYTNVLDFGGINDWPYEVVK